MTTDYFFPRLINQQRELDKVGLKKSEQTKNVLNKMWNEKR